MIVCRDAFEAGVMSQADTTEHTDTKPSKGSFDSLFGVQYKGLPTRNIQEERALEGFLLIVTPYHNKLTLRIVCCIAFSVALAPEHTILIQIS